MGRFDVRARVRGKRGVAERPVRGSREARVFFSAPGNDGWRNFGARVRVLGGGGGGGVRRARPAARVEARRERRRGARLRRDGRRASARRARGVRETYDAHDERFVTRRRRRRIVVLLGGTHRGSASSEGRGDSVGERTRDASTGRAPRRRFRRSRRLGWFFRKTRGSYVLLPHAPRHAQRGDAAQPVRPARRGRGDAPMRRVGERVCRRGGGRVRPRRRQRRGVFADALPRLFDAKKSRGATGEGGALGDDLARGVVRAAGGHRARRPRRALREALQQLI
mmetsp:Transcript_899/g.3775  ORF Transcript_899/g.3775 Transcript_899/m.3775 type:complete len:281 (+) Transcript_899:3384-4226(+)